METVDSKARSFLTCLFRQSSNPRTWVAVVQAYDSSRAALGGYAPVRYVEPRQDRADGRLFAWNRCTSSKTSLECPFLFPRGVILEVFLERAGFLSVAMPRQAHDAKPAKSKLI